MTSSFRPTIPKYPGLTGSSVVNLLISCNFHGMSRLCGENQNTIKSGYWDVVMIRSGISIIVMGGRRRRGSSCIACRFG
jgi:hypothetical protein